MKSDINLECSFHNRFDIVVRDAKTLEIKQRAEAFNVICNRFWDNLFNTTIDGWVCRPRNFGGIRVGSGTGTPSSSDTDLFNRLGEKRFDLSTEEKVSNYDTGIVYIRNSIRLEAGDYVGQTLTEVGLADLNFNGSAWIPRTVSHAMLKDLNGNQISIAKTSTDIIDIYATLFLHFTVSGYQNGLIKFKEKFTQSKLVDLLLSDYDDYNYGSIVYYIESVGYSNMKIVSSPGSSRVNKPWNINTYSNTNNVKPTVSRQNKTTSWSYRFNASEGNAPIRVILFDTSSQTGFLIFYRALYTPSLIVGESVATGNGSTTAFSTKFSVLSDAKVYVDGVEQTSGVTIYETFPDTNSYIMYMLAIERFNSTGVPLYGYIDNFYDKYVEREINGSHFLGVLISSLSSAGVCSQIFENLDYQKLGISSFLYASDLGNATYLSYIRVRLSTSNDGINFVELLPWTTFAAAVNSFSIDASYRRNKYFKIDYQQTHSMDYQSQKYVVFNFTVDPADKPDPLHNIVFDTAPASGAVITADYVPDCIPKDENHVLDINVTMTFNEHLGT